MAARAAPDAAGLFTALSERQKKGCAAEVLLGVPVFFYLAVGCVVCAQVPAMWRG